jgi:hypothetical protein
MLVIMTENQVFPPQKVCQTCLMADQSGQPRWYQGKLRCGHALRKLADNLPDQYECEMGFRIAHIEG